MRKQTWIRYGLSSVIMLGGTFAALAVGCGGDDSGPITPNDASADHTNFPDTGGGETGIDSGGNEGGGGDADAAAPKHAKIIIVHSAPYAPDFRFCFGIGTMDNGSDLAVAPGVDALPHDDSNLPAGKTYPGLYAGTGGALPDLIDLEPKAVTGFIIPVPNSKLTNDVKSNSMERDCATLIGSMGQGTSTGLVKNTDFFQLPTIPHATFKKNNTYLLALTGCTPGNPLPAAQAKAQCGQSYDATTGNLGIKLVQLDRTVADPTKLGLQVLHVASAIDGFVGANPSFNAGVKNFIGLAPDDGGMPSNAPVGNGVNFGYFGPDAAAPQVYSFPNDYQHLVAYDQIVGLTSIPGNLDAGTDASVVATTVSTPAIPLPYVQALTYGTFDGGIGIGPAGMPLYVPGANYTLILLGDPTAQQLVADGGRNPLYDGHGIHFLMFPNDPPLPKL